MKVYSLVNPLDDTCFYIGVTNSELSVRLNGHMNSTDENLGKVAVIKYIVAHNSRPEINLLEEVPDDNPDFCCQREQFWLKKFQSEGHPLTNRSFNGAGRRPESDPKKPLTLYLKKSIIDSYGGSEKLRDFIYGQLGN